MKDLDTNGSRPMDFDRCQSGNNTPELQERAQFSRLLGATPFDPSAEVVHLRQLAYDAFHSELQEPENQLSKEIHALEDYTLLKDQVLQKLSEPDLTRRMPVAKVEFNAIGGTVSIGFEPGCLDFDAKKDEVKVQISRPLK
jgi:hypothetical protein